MPGSSRCCFSFQRAQGIGRSLAPLTSLDTGCRRIVGRGPIFPRQGGHRRRLARANTGPHGAKAGCLGANIGTDGAEAGTDGAKLIPAGGKAPPGGMTSYPTGAAVAPLGGAVAPAGMSSYPAGGTSYPSEGSSYPVGGSFPPTRAAVIPDKTRRRATLPCLRPIRTMELVVRRHLHNTNVRRRQWKTFSPS